MANICIVGGGVVGLNIALALSQKSGDEIFLFEKEKFLGHHTSTRNSEVIHAGFAYPPDSLKAKLCVEGNKMTYELLAKLGVANKKCGKWVIACDQAEANALVEVKKNADICGVEGFELRNVEELLQAEPSLQNVVACAFSAASGIMDASAYIRALEVELSRRQNVNLLYPCCVTGIDTIQKLLQTDRGEMPFDMLINAAGLWADEILSMKCRGEDFQMCDLYQIIPFKGEYYRWKNGGIKTMIYPVPSRFIATADDADATLVSSMGIHTHRNIAGELFVGPSQIKLTPDKKDDYSISTPPEIFAKELSRFVKNVSASDLEPAYAGNRPKLYKNGRPFGDFDIWRDGDIIHLLGIESPALTAAPAIAKHVCGLI